MLRKEQLCEEKEILLRREYDAINLKGEEVCHQQHVIETEKSRVEELARSVEAQSREVAQFRESSERVRKQWEERSGELDDRTEAIRRDKEKVDEARREIVQRHRSLENMRYGYVKEKSIEESMIQLKKSAGTFLSASGKKQRQPNQSSTLFSLRQSPARLPHQALEHSTFVTPKSAAKEKPSSSFSAREFIADLEQEVPLPRLKCVVREEDTIYAVRGGGEEFAAEIEAGWADRARWKPGPSFCEKQAAYCPSRNVMISDEERGVDVHDWCFGKYTQPVEHPHRTHVFLRVPQWQ